MARLSQATRQYILNRLLQASLTRLEQQIHRLMPALYRGKIDIVKTRQEHNDRHPSRLHFREAGYPDIFGANACGIKDSFIKKQGEQLAAVPRKFYQEHLDNKTYEVKVEFEECMIKPRETVIYPGEDKAFKKAAAACRRSLRNQWDAAQEGASELRRLVMEANKLLAEAEERVMLAGNDDAEGLMAIFTKRMNKTLA